MPFFMFPSVFNFLFYLHSMGVTLAEVEADIENFLKSNNITAAEVEADIEAFLQNTGYTAEDLEDFLVSKGLIMRV